MDWNKSEPQKETSITLWSWTITLVKADTQILYNRKSWIYFSTLSHCTNSIKHSSVRSNKLLVGLIQRIKLLFITSEKLQLQDWLSMKFTIKTPPKFINHFHTLNNNHNHNNKTKTFFTANLCNLGTSSSNRALVRRISALIATADALPFSFEAVSAFYTQKF